MPLTERILWSSEPDLPGVDILSVENNQRAWRVYHETYTICNIGRFTDDRGIPAPGEAEWVYRGKVHHSGPRSVMLLEHGEIHRNTKIPPPCNFSVLLIDPKLFSGIAAESGLGASPHFRQASVSEPILYRAFSRFHSALAQGNSLLNRQSLLVNCIGTLLASHCERHARPFADPGRRRLQRARDFLEQHFSQNVSLGQLAEISDLSRFHLLRAFAREFGLPPHAFQINLRVERVRVLLKSGVPLHSIEAGFADQSHLTRHFRRAMGITPGQYAAMVARSG